ncbi:type II toxin-antitoxin system Phd/YefM family antitoxin [Egibacter rhizosphaerae]|uniref:Antitoxin n=1 Tax=Egibacter rhizosphaerae TaxID=1670831 RepID=A0A411YHF9_9ACTN|nr:type II toxin-antitoxin system prevent-host-death family antitoxin [Egibacter rhizosphaerae]QBI20775.1 type II toxin-antitoxin system Phd/YefM family antitoxin [Egibacter rhizosphaerae]
MISVSVSEFKARLSRYLREVRRGGEVQVLDRGRPVARLTAMPGGEAPDSDAHREHLIRSGTLRAGTGEPWSAVAAPPIQTSAEVSDALAEDRADRL